MSLPRLETSMAKMPKLLRSRSASLRERSLASSFLSSAKDLRRSLAGGLPPVCMTRSCPAYDGKVDAHGAEGAQQRVEANTVLHGEQ
eukprot:3959183-Pleurochrysis_carterae.AAC.1